MLSRGSIQFYINGPPPIARLTGRPVSDVVYEDKPPEREDSSLESENIIQIESLVSKTHNILLTIRSIRLFDFFPDKVIIDENKVSFIFKDAFGVRSIHSVLIENITYVEAHTSFMTGSLVVVDSSNYRHPIELKIDNLRKESAIRARKLIQGLVHAKAINLDLKDLNAFEMEKRLEELGMVSGED